jgi:hypothetical protein
LQAVPGSEADQLITHLGPGPVACARRRPGLLS